MRRIVVFALAASLATTPVVAGDTEEGFSLMEEGAKLVLRGLMQEMEPAMEDLRRFSEEIEPGFRQLMEEMGPALVTLMGKIDDFTAYHPPEILPNGDIIFRRKTPLEQEQKQDQGKGDGEEIEL
ncbi:hypothetical protein RXV86_04535 [Alisedimentitalea sp. MJ-SS2]|uniref:hypothetical protein n=1 Tax=Aliisedimentitalea sp. MJ-SS2 TaxID=3049795 RepID=UPI0029123CE4|nr:hypothetical protein [Alisedimentitalea sp. MJ-SS2]MDU8926646.1 hypothetical protein [Alisedimentitalea sp. MJ-SS2]